MTSIREVLLSALLVLGFLQVADAAVWKNELRKSKLFNSQQDSNVHSAHQEHRNTGRQGAKVGMHREQLLFARQRFHSHHKKMGRRFSNADEMQVIHKTAYWGTVKVGTPAQEFKVIFDTGSGNLILPAKSCNMAGCNPHRKFSPKDSSTAAAVVNERGESSTEISFGTGDISGDYYQDKFCIAENLCTNVRFVAATQQSEQPFAETPFDGILGLGFNDLSMGKHFNILDDLNAGGQLPKGTFAVYLTDDSSSEITFGGYKPEQVASDIVWAKVVRESYWQVGVDDITFNNNPTGLCKGGCQVAVDTGTSMLAGPSDLVEELTDKLAAKDDCSNFDKLPTIGFKIKNKVLNLSPDDYMDKSDGDCSFSVMSLDVPPPKGPLFIFGDPFLRRFVTIYDKNGPRVGFAVAKHGNLDAAGAAKIISDVKGSHAETGAKEQELTPGFTVAMSLESGMMTRDSGSADHSGTTASESDSSEDESKAEEAKKESKPESASSLSNDFSHAVDKWLKGSETRAHAAINEASASLVQRQEVGLRGRRFQEDAQQLISIKLHKIDKSNAGRI